MTGLTLSFDNALAQDRALVTLFIQVEFPTHTMRLMVGAATLNWDGVDFGDVDTLFGTLGAIDEIEDGEGDQAPGLGFTMFPPSNSTAAQLSAPGNQGSPVKVWLAGISPVTGLVIPEPYLLFAGEMDQATLNIGKGTRSVDLDCISEFDRLLEDDEGARLSDAFHQSIWPGETGMANVTGVEEAIYWGLATPADALTVTPATIISTMVTKGYL